MVIHRNHIVIRIIGSLVATGFLSLGLYAVLGITPDMPELNRDRSFWFGVTSIVAALFAFVLSWLIKDIKGVWCAPPPRKIFDD